MGSQSEIAWDNLTCQWFGRKFAIHGIRDLWTPKSRSFSISNGQMLQKKYRKQRLRCWPGKSSCETQVWIISSKQYVGGFKSTKDGCFCCNLAAILQRRACPESLLVFVNDNLFIFVPADIRSLRTRVVWCCKPSLFLRDSSFTRFPCYVLAFVKGRGSTLMLTLCNIAFWVELDSLDILNTVV